MKILHLLFVILSVIILGFGLKLVQATDMSIPNPQVQLSQYTRYVDGPASSIVLDPLEQFKSGISLDNITCNDGFFLAISIEKTPLCLKAGTISKLATRGFLYGINENKNETNYTTVLIPPGSENQNSNKTYSPNIVMVTIGVNNTVRWVNQADVGNSVVSDILVEQGGKMFSSDYIGPGHSYEFTFTNPGTYHYHGAPHPWQLGTVIVSQMSENTTSPASFMPCDTFFPQSNSGVAVLYMPKNSIGKLCVRYSNFNDFPAPFRGIKITNADNLTHEATEISTWNDAGDNTTLPKGNFTTVYWIKTGNQTGLYGLTIFCSGMPFAVGYNDKSNFTLNDFPWEKSSTISCPMMTYQYKIDSLSGIGVKYIPYP